ncbi:hypothetical protein DRW07_15620 [Alteromonas sediminis]|uniref:Uncharacterized protein n=1 Tax=Alteromonas sediminis TaxID=2259342 RepID=A0A3N5XX41_9ALTE|nr:tetratricopeptide repeat protein [Alteromonas sediminis]RPJ65332.1 hypothetical protein DRW07_15620 [Alteromonas sediminis]
MSVVNQMLNDLEKREATAQSHASYQPPAKNKRLQPLLGIGLLLLTVAAVATVLFYPEESERPLPLNSQPHDTQTATDAVETQPADVSASSEVSASNVVPLPEEPVGESDVRDEIQNTLPEQPKPSVTTDEEEDRGQSAPVVETALVPVAETPRFSVSQSQRTVTPPEYRVLVADAMAKNEHAKAQALLKSWIEAEPNNVDPLKKLAAIAFANGQFIQAENVLNLARERALADPSIRMMQARLYKRTGNISKALTALNFDSQSPEVLHYRAALARETAQYEIAQRDYQLLTSLNKTDLKAWLGLAVVSERMGNIATAVSAYRQVVALAGNKVEIQAYAEQQLQVLSTQVGELE